MTTLPASGYLSNSARTQGEAKTALEAIPAFLRERFGSGGGWASVASATTTDLSSQTGRMILVTGTTTITGFGTTSQGDNALFMVRFAGILTLTNGPNLILPTGANITTAAGDIALVVWEGSNVWRVIGYFRANGLPLVQPQALTVATPQNTTSGTSIDFTGIPSTAKRVTLMLANCSLSGAANFLVQLGSGSIQTTGYSGSYDYGGAQTAVTSGIGAGAGSASSGFVGHIVFTLVGSNLWVASGVVRPTGASAGGGITTGYVTLSGALDRLRLTTSNGADTFDAGTATISYE